MAKGRMIAKAISLDEKVNALPDDTCRLLFTWLITHLDCEGRMYGDPQTVKSIVFPRRSISVRKVEYYLNFLEKRELIFRYCVNGNQYLWMKNFEKHQVGLKKEREARSQIPPITQDLIRSDVGSKVGYSPTEVKVKVKVKVYTYTVIYNHWNNQNIIVHKQLTDSIRRAIDHALKENTKDEILTAISNYAEILSGGEYYFKYRWTLQDFLRRGIAKFSSLEVAKSNYRRDKDGKTKGHSRELPTAYTPTRDDYPDV